MKIKNLYIVGTSHIAVESLRDVEHAIEKYLPKIVAVELDQGRARALLSGKKSKLRIQDIRIIGVKGFLFAWLGALAERKLGESVGMKPGDEMIHAMRLARKNKAMVMLIDQDISVTLKRFSQFLSWKEKFRIAADILKGLITRKPVIEFDLRTVPDKKVVKSLTSQVKKRYPNVYRVLIGERNQVLAQRLIALMLTYPDDMIVAVMGAGHEDEVIDLIKKGLAQAKHIKTQNHVKTS